MSTGRPAPPRPPAPQLPHIIGATLLPADCSPATAAPFPSTQKALLTLGAWPLHFPPSAHHPAALPWPCFFSFFKTSWKMSFSRIFSGGVAWPLSEDLPLIHLPRTPCCFNLFTSCIAFITVCNDLSPSFSFYCLPPLCIPKGRNLLWVISAVSQCLEEYIDRCSKKYSLNGLIFLSRSNCSSVNPI